jgi:hypothetical protein
METINTTIPGQTLRKHLQLNGMADGNIVVPAGVWFILNGTVCGDLLIEASGTAEVNGVVTGSVSDQGGQLIIRGVVYGKLQSTPDSDVTIQRGASINGQRH